MVASDRQLLPEDHGGHRCRILTLRQDEKIAHVSFDGPSATVLRKNRGSLYCTLSMSPILNSSVRPSTTADPTVLVLAAPVGSTS